MTTMLRQLATRRVRGVIQIAALVAVIAATVLTAIDEAATRSVATLLMGVVILVLLKIVLVTVQRQQAGDGTAALRAEVASLRSSADGVSVEVERLAAELDPLSEALLHQEGLSRRTEPAMAEFATLRHEVMYLRETVERLRSDLDR